jgi:hypothetical protein
MLANGQHGSKRGIMAAASDVHQRHRCAQLDAALQSLVHVILLKYRPSFLCEPVPKRLCGCFSAALCLMNGKAQGC